MTGRTFELRLRNHRGALLHVIALLARRGFDATALVAAIDEEDPARLRLALCVQEDGRLPRLVRELERLYDVLDVRQVSESASPRVLVDFPARFSLAAG